MKLVKADNLTPSTGNFVFKRTELKILGDASFTEWEEFGETLKKMRDGINFWMGDWLNFGEAHYGDKYTQALDATDYAKGTLQNASYVARMIAPSLRREDLSFGHHQNVANLDPGQQEFWLQRASEENWSVKEMRKQIKGETKTETKHECPNCGFKF